MFDEYFNPQDNVQAENEELKTLVSREQEKNKFLYDEVTYLREIIEGFQRDKFGKKSERWESPEQCVFDEIEVESKKVDPYGEDNVKDDSIQSDIEVPKHTRKRGYRRPLPATLPREIEKIELPLDEQVADDGTQLRVIGWEKSEKLKYEPAKLFVIEIHRAKYGVDAGDYVKTAPPAPALIPKGFATPELLSAITISKYADGLPLYRLEEIFERQGIEITRGTMARWMIILAKACQPILNVLSDRFYDSFYVACDETKIQVLKENGRKAESKSWMWVRSTPFGPRKVVLFDYKVSRAGPVAQELFADYEGYLQTDGLATYNKIESEKVIRIGCNMHGRRYFEKAAVEGAEAGKSLGEEAVSFYKRIYDLEREIKDFPPDDRYRIRLERAQPIWDDFKEWALAQKVKVPVKSKIGKAFYYFESHYEHLIGYLKDGRLEPDNGFTERAIRKFAIGRNNWLFSTSEDGAKASALLYSLVVTAKVNGVNPHKALVKMFDQLPLAKTIDDYERLTELILTPEPGA